MTASRGSRPTVAKAAVFSCRCQIADHIGGGWLPTPSTRDACPAVARASRTSDAAP
jgi:hypothetical protein